MKSNNYCEEITPENNPKFYEVAHEFGLLVDNEIHLTRAKRRDKSIMKDDELKRKAYYGK